MANLGISNASYYTDRFITKLNKEVVSSVNRLSTARKDVIASDIASLKSMDYSFKLDVASTKAAVKNMAMTQAYLSTAITSLDNASAILARIHELAVLGANSTNTTDQQSALTVEAEALADEFHKSMSSADFKGKLVFDTEENSQIGTISLGRNTAGTAEFGIGAIDYDFFYDYKNPSTDRYNTGLTYRITDELSDAEKAALLSRLPGATEEDLVVGYEFVAQAQEKVGEGLEVADLTYNRSEGAKQFDALASFAGDGEFDGYHLEFQVSENNDSSDNLTIESTGNIRVLGVGEAGNPLDVELIQYFDTDHNEWIDIAKIDEDKNGVDGAVLRVNLLSDATIPDPTSVPNGTFQDSFTFTTEVIMDPVYGPPLEADGSVTQVPLMETVEVPLWDDVAETIPTMVQATQTVTRQQEINGVPQTQPKMINEVQDVLDGDGNPVINDSGQVVTQTVQVQEVINGVPQTEPLMETVEVPLWDDVAETIPTMVQATQTVTRQVEINGVLQTEDAPDVIIRYDPREITEERPNNWHYFEDNVDFGSNFTIYEGYNAPDLINGGIVTGDPNTAVSVPTPTEAEMINPGYEDYVVTATRQDGTETTTTRSASIDIKRHHDDHPIASLASGGNDLEISVETVGGDKELKLDTGFIEFEPDDKFGIFHGPATVSNEFQAEAGDFLKFDYDARIVDDNFHVAGYIYNVATNEITMALDATDSYGAGTASIEVTEDATYRFVFVVGTYDLTGGMEAGSNMKIDNVRAEDAYDIEQDAIDELLKALHYSNQSANAAASKVLSTSLLEGGTENVLITDLSDINITGVSGQPEGPFMEIAGRNLVTTPSDALTENNSSIMTSKIEAVQQEINSARVKAASQLLAISSAIESSTDLSSQFALGSGTLTDLNFSSETAYLARRQIQHDIATAMLAQANLGQSHLISLLTQ